MRSGIARILTEDLVFQDFAARIRADYADFY